MELDAASARLLESQLDTMKSLGFEIELFGPNMYQVRSLPALLIGVDPAAAVRVVIEDFEEDEAPLQNEIADGSLAEVEFFEELVHAQSGDCC